MTLYKPAKFELWWADTARSRSLPAAFLFTDSSKTLQVCEGQLPFISQPLPQERLSQLCSTIASPTSADRRHDPPSRYLTDMRNGS